jgi:hypothetical protein
VFEDGLAAKARRLEAAQYSAAVGAAAAELLDTASQPLVLMPSPGASAPLQPLHAALGSQHSGRGRGALEDARPSSHPGSTHLGASRLSAAYTAVQFAHEAVSGGVDGGPLRRADYPAIDEAGLLATLAMLPGPDVAQELAPAPSPAWGTAQLQLQPLSSGHMSEGSQAIASELAFQIPSTFLEWAAPAGRPPLAGHHPHAASTPTGPAPLHQHHSTGHGLGDPQPLYRSPVPRPLWPDPGVVCGAGGTGRRDFLVELPQARSRTPSASGSKPSGHSGRATSVHHGQLAGSWGAEPGSGGPQVQPAGAAAAPLHRAGAPGLASASGASVQPVGDLWGQAGVPLFRPDRRGGQHVGNQQEGQHAPHAPHQHALLRQATAHAAIGRSASSSGLHVLPAAIESPSTTPHLAPSLLPAAQPGSNLRGSAFVRQATGGTDGGSSTLMGALGPLLAAELEAGLVAEEGLEGAGEGGHDGGMTIGWIGAFTRSSI